MEISVDFSRLWITQHEDQRKKVVPTWRKQRIVRVYHENSSVDYVEIQWILELLDAPYLSDGERGQYDKDRATPVDPPPKRKWSQITRNLVIDLLVVEGTQKVVVLIDQ